jgi:hypothetical protein
MTLVLSHPCRVRKRLISLINSATFFEIMWFARCEYSEHVSDVKTFTSRKFFPDLASECQCIRRVVSMYSKSGVKISTSDVSLSLSFLISFDSDRNWKAFNFWYQLDIFKEAIRYHQKCVVFLDNHEQFYDEI